MVVLTELPLTVMMLTGGVAGCVAEVNKKEFLCVV